MSSTTFTAEITNYMFISIPCVPSPADQLGVTVNDDGLELWPQAGASFNIGIMMFRPASMMFVGETLQDALMPEKSSVLIFF